MDTTLNTAFEWDFSVPDWIRGLIATLYHTPPSPEDANPRKWAAAQLANGRCENPVVSIFGSRIAFNGSYAIEDSDLDVLYDGVTAAEARRLVSEWLAKNPKVGPPNVEVNLIPGRTHWHVEGFSYYSIDLLGPAKLFSADGFPAQVRAWAMGGGQGLPRPGGTGDNAGPVDGPAVLNALEWARRRGCDLNKLVDVAPLGVPSVVLQSNQEITDLRLRVKNAEKEAQELRSRLARIENLLKN